MKLTTTNVSHASTANTTRINVTSHRGGPLPAQGITAEAAPVVQTPYKQHTWADGTVTAPSWSPLDVDANLSGPGQWNRSHAETVARLNPAGDPTTKRGPNQPQNLPEGKPQSILFARPSGPRRKIVGSHARLTPAKMSSVLNSDE